ncbi:MAG: DUF3024 domain-containing protein [Ectothiorhodospira sp.]
MALSEFETKQIERAVAGFMERRRPPEHIRPKLDIGHRVTGQSLELFEVRPRWDNPSEQMEHAIAKATYVKRSETWKVYWQRADLKWHRYEPHPEAQSVEEFLAVVDEDKYGCFFG